MSISPVYIYAGYLSGQDIPDFFSAPYYHDCDFFCDYQYVRVVQSSVNKLRKNAYWRFCLVLRASANEYMKETSTHNYNNYSKVVAGDHSWLISLIN